MAHEISFLSDECTSGIMCASVRARARTCGWRVRADKKKGETDRREMGRVGGGK